MRRSHAGRRLGCSGRYGKQEDAASQSHDRDGWSTKQGWPFWGQPGGTTKMADEYWKERLGLGPVPPGPDRKWFHPGNVRVRVCVRTAVRNGVMPVLS
jgi:hypothetical protein